MRSLTTFIALSQFLFFACDFPSILSEDQAVSADEADPVQQLLVVRTTGGFAGVDRTLTVDEAGKATYIDRFHPGAEWVIALSGSELDSLVALFLDNDFFDLGDSYFDPQVADAFHFSIVFNHNQDAKAINTDGIAAPGNLQAILEGIGSLERKIGEQTLSIRLELDSDQINAGDEIAFTLFVTNENENPLSLLFNSGQIFDFYAIPEQESDNSVEPRVFSWNWAHGQAFVQVIQELELKSGETRSYQVTWDGRDNEGNSLTGELVIGAELISVPGGRPKHERLTILDAK